MKRSRLRAFWARLRSSVHRDLIEREFDDELGTHLELLIDLGRRRGLSEVDARREALLKLGRPAALRDRLRDARGLPLADAFARDSRHALRMLRRSPAFTVIVTCTLALGIGANTALFSLADNLLRRSLPVRDPDLLVQLQIFGFQGAARNTKPLASQFDRTVFESVRARHDLFGEVVGFMPTDRTEIAVDGAVEPEREVQLISSNFFSGLGVTPIVGRPPDSSDDHVAVISERWWRTRFGAREDVIRRGFTIDGTSYTIVGVAPVRFHGFDLDKSADIWLTTVTEDLLMIARLQRGVAADQVRGAVHPLLRQAVEPKHQADAMETDVLPVGQGFSALRNQYKGALLALTGLVTLVLLTTCANVGSLIMLRNAARRRELIVRAALGAGRSRLVVQSLVESVMLGAAGCLAGLVFARWGVSIVVSMLPLPVPPAALTFHADARVVGFAAGVSMLSAVLYGLGPAWRTTDLDLTGLRSGPGITVPRCTRRLGRVLVASQVAMSLLLIVGAGLFVQTLRNLSRLETGLSTERLVQVSIDTRFAGYREDALIALSNLLFDRVSAVAGVRSVTRTRSPLMQGSSTMLGLPLPGLGRTLQMWDAVEVGPQFFETMGIAVVRGHTFTAADFVDNGAELRQLSAQRTAPAMRDHVRKLGPFVINEAFAKHYPANVDPLAPTSPIAGIVKDVKVFDPKGDVTPTMFFPSRRPGAIRALQIRTSGDSHVIEPAIREAIQSVNPKLFQGISTLGEASRRNFAKERLVAVISGFFGVLALSLASIGIFGIASSTVSQRTRELGIRRALGAGQWSVVRESLRGTLVVITLGLTAGAVASVVAVRLGASFVAGLLFGLTPTDATNLAASIGVMIVAALAACALPAFRATRIDPLAVIRNE